MSASNICNQAALKSALYDIAIEKGTDIIRMVGHGFWSTDGMDAYMSLLARSAGVVRSRRSTIRVYADLRACSVRPSNATTLMRERNLKLYRPSDRKLPLDRVGVRLNPALSNLGGVKFDEETYPLFEHVVRKLDGLGLAYLHLMEPINPVDDLNLPTKTVGAHFRPLYRGTIITATDYTRETGNQVIERGDADLVAFGRAFIGNPDLVERFDREAPLTVPDRATFYGGGATGYVDYPRLDDEADVETVPSDKRVGLDYATARARIREK